MMCKKQVLGLSGNDMMRKLWAVQDEPVMHDRLPENKDYMGAAAVEMLSMQDSALCLRGCLEKTIDYRRG